MQFPSIKYLEFEQLVHCEERRGTQLKHSDAHIDILSLVIPVYEGLLRQIEGRSLMPDSTHAWQFDESKVFSHS